MSFLSALHRGLEVGIGVAKPLLPVAGLIPGVGGVFGTVLTTVTALEQLIPQDGTGPTKKEIATNIVNTAVPGIDPAALSVAIDHLVAAANALKPVAK